VHYLDLNGALWLEDATTAIYVGVHLHHVWVDGRVEDDPGTTTKLSVGRDVNKEGLLEVAEGVHDVRAILQNLVKHVALASRESPPVGKNDQRELFSLVEVVDGLRRLEGRVWEPHLTSLLVDLLLRVSVGRVGGNNLLHGSRLNGNHSHRDASEASPPSHNCLGPSDQKRTNSDFRKRKRKRKRKIENSTLQESR